MEQVLAFERPPGARAPLPPLPPLPPSISDGEALGLYRLGRCEGWGLIARLMIWATRHNRPAGRE